MEGEELGGWWKWVYVCIQIATVAYVMACKERVDERAALGIVSDSNLIKLVTNHLPAWYNESDKEQVEESSLLTNEDVTH